MAIYGDDLILGPSNAGYQGAFDWVNKYAGQIDQPASSPGAWVALRPGDPAVDNGIAGVRNPQGNYSMHMVQIAPTQTSADVLSWTPGAAGALGVPGVNPIGSAAQSEGRFARKTVQAAPGSNQLWFRLSDPFRSGLPSGAGTCQLNVTYLDTGTHSFSARYGSGTSDAFTTTLLNSGQWNTAASPLFDCAKLQGALPGPVITGSPNADVVLAQSGSGDTTFHKVEVAVVGR